MSRLNEIFKTLQPFKEVDEDFCISNDDVDWMLARISRLEEALNEINENAFQHDDDSISSAWLVHCTARALEEDS